VVVFVALVGGDLFVHSSVRGVWFVGSGVAFCLVRLLVLHFAGLFVLVCDEFGCVLRVSLVCDV